MESNIPTQSTPPAQQSKLPKWLTTVTPISKALAMILFIGLPFAGFYLGMKYQEKTIVGTLSTVEVKTTSPKTINLAPTPIDTSNWKTYENTIFGYSIKYPKSWFEQGPYGGQAGYGCIENIVYGAIAEFSKSKLIDCGFVGEQLPPQDADVTVWILNQKFQSLENILGPDYSFTQIAGEKATKYPFTEKSGLPNAQATRIYFNHNNKGYIIYLKQSDKKGTYDYSYDQILSTFKFTDQIQTGCNTDSDCQNGAKCMGVGPIIANQPVRKVCIQKGQAIPL